MKESLPRDSSQFGELAIPRSVPKMKILHQFGPSLMAPIIAILLFAIPLYATGVLTTVESYARAPMRLSLATLSNRFKAASALSGHFIASFAKSTEASRQQYMKYVRSKFPESKQPSEGGTQPTNYLTVTSRPAPAYHLVPKLFPIPPQPYGTAVAMSAETIHSLARILFCSSAPFPNDRHKLTVDHPRCTDFEHVFDHDQPKEANLHLITTYNEHMIYFGVRMLWTTPRQSLNGSAEDAALVKLKMLEALEKLPRVIESFLAFHHDSFRSDTYAHPQVYFTGYGTGGLGALWLAYRYLESGFLKDNQSNAIKVVTWEEDLLHLNVGNDADPLFVKLHRRLGAANHLIWTTKAADNYRKSFWTPVDFTSTDGVPVLLGSEEYHEKYYGLKDKKFGIAQRMPAEYLLSPYHRITSLPEYAKSLDGIKDKAISRRTQALSKLQTNPGLVVDQLSPWGSWVYEVASRKKWLQTINHVENVEHLTTHMKHLEAFYKLSTPDNFARGIEEMLKEEAELWMDVLRKDIKTSVFPDAHISCKSDGYIGEPFTPVSHGGIPTGADNSPLERKSFEPISSSDEAIDRVPDEEIAPPLRRILDLASKSVPGCSFGKRVWKARCTVQFSNGMNPMNYFRTRSKLELEFVGSRRKGRVRPVASELLQAQHALKTKNLKELTEASVSDTENQGRNSRALTKMTNYDKCEPCLQAIASSKQPTFLRNAYDLKDIKIRGGSSVLPSFLGLNPEFYWTPSRFVYHDMYRLLLISPSLFVKVFAGKGMTKGYPQECSGVLPLFQHPIAFPKGYNREGTKWDASHRYCRRVLRKFLVHVQTNKSVLESPPPQRSGISAWASKTLDPRSAHPGVLIGDPQGKELTYRVNLSHHNQASLLLNPSSTQSLLQVLSSPPTKTFATDATHAHNRLLPHAFPAFLNDPKFDPISKHMLFVPDTKFVISIVPASWAPYGNRNLTTNFVKAAGTGDQPWAVIEAVPEHASSLHPHLYWLTFRAYLFTRP